MADYPIGDPTGGPAYGEKRDPISAAISLFSMAGTYALAGSFTAMTIFQGITFAGAALSLIGNVTGNKALSNIGMIAGLAGGVGMFADKMLGGAPTGGTLGEAFDSGKRALFGSNVDISTVFAPASGSVTPVVDGMQAVDAAKGLDAANSSVGLANKLPDAPTLAGPAGAPAPAAANLAITPGSAASSIVTPEVSPAGNTAAAIPTAPGADLGVNPLTGKANPLMSYAPGFGPNAAAKDLTNPSVLDELKAGNFGAAASRVGSGAMAMLKDNPTGAYVAAQAIGAGVDYLSGKTDAELDQLKASTGYANAKALEVQTALDREIARRANKNMAYNTIDAGVRVKPPGLIASNMQQST